ncbi:hypothetical protein BKI52_42525 [marine bacterium AO1-C]|nr:hypothetical protein BKI52_42525 [marine bacterium AO1-C]
MSQNKSVKQVILIGQLVVNVPVTLIMIGLPYLSWHLFDNGWLIGTGLSVGLILAWTWWSFSIVFWRIWAFEHTSKKDWLALKIRAIEAQLIWPDGHRFEKTEIRTKAQRKKIEAINREIETPHF